MPCHENHVKNAAAHTRHKPDSPANQCISCHMPTTSFARMNRTDHSMLPPAPSATIADPFETADHEGMDYNRWRIEHLFLLVPAQQYVGQFLDTFREFPPRQKAGSFALDQVLDSLQKAPKGGGN